MKPMSLKQAPNFLRWLTDSEVTKFLGRQYKNLTLEQEKQHLKKICLNKDQIAWSIFAKDGVHIGSTSITPISRENKKTDWGIIIGEKNYWNQGYGQDTLRTVMKYSFDKLKLNRFGLSVYNGNLKAIKCYTKCGLKKEGVKRQSIYRYGKYWNEIIMSILKSEYKKLKK